jgi:DNA-binding protein HU-beta
MNKTQLIGKISEEAGISKAAARRAVNALTEAVTEALKDGDQVALVGFGTFSVRERAARSGRNPQSGESIEISAAKIPSFKAGKALKDSVDDDGHG